ncbi:MAG: hypothetical protein ACXU82_02420 [Caulobacteraceae bacterium]
MAAPGWAALTIALAVSGPALANDFVVRTAGAATVIAIDRDSVLKTSHYRTGWTYELYRERNPFVGRRTQITGVLLLANCKTLLSRRLKVVHYLEDGTALSRIGPEPVWTESLRGSNTDLMLRAMCRPPDRVWARRRAETVFDLYGQVWR